MPAKTRKTAAMLATIMALRMLGLFMILPIFALYVNHYRGATPQLIGLALGIYGFSQAALQFPMGMLSDKIGRKPIIAFGMVLFIIGSIVAATAHSIDQLIIGRLVQGSGAIGSSVIALMADLTDEKYRTQAMAIIGVTIGSSFAIAIVLGPILNSLVGISGIFWLMAVLGVLAIAVLYFVIPTPDHVDLRADTELRPKLLAKTLKNTELLRLNWGIASSHAIITALFLAIPSIITHYAGLAPAHQWFLYLPVLVIAYLLMVPFIIIGEKRQALKQTIIGAVFALLCALVGLVLLPHHLWIIAICLLIFFTSFSLLEASMPSTVSKLAGKQAKGTASGIFSTCQYFGIFLGGSIGGLVLNDYGNQGILVLCISICLLWLLVTLGMKQPKKQN